MPELPEVETVRNVLLPIVKGRKIIKIDVLRSKTIISGADEFVKALTGQTFLDVTRIGKFLIFHLSNELVFLSHLRMEGKYYQYKEKEENSKHARIIFHLNDNSKLIYDDSRSFGIMKLTNEKNFLKEKEIAQLGKEPFDIDDEYIEVIMKRNKNSSLPIKSTLLDQTLMTGLGNIYADEVLFKSRINPLKKAKDITKKEWEILVKNSKDTLLDAIKAGGSTIRSYHPGKGIDGEFQTSLLCYGKKGEKCSLCGHPFHFITVNGRGTTYCPQCQKLTKNKIIVGLTGKIASGKTTVMNLFKERGINAISSDEIVSDLYKEDSILYKDIEKALNITFKERKIDKEIIREHLLSYPKDKTKLEKIVHPLVKERLIEFVNKNNGIIILEVPLLFESKMDKMCDFIIALDIDEKIQLERLKKRNLDSALALNIINSTNKFESYKNRVDYMLNNNSTIKDLAKQVDDVINKLKSFLD